APPAFEPAASDVHGASALRHLGGDSVDAESQGGPQGPAAPAVARCRGVRRRSAESTRDGAGAEGCGSILSGLGSRACGRRCRLLLVRWAFVVGGADGGAPQQTTRSSGVNE